MTYCTLAQLITEFGEAELIQLTDREGNSLIDESIVNAAIARAAGDINSYLRTKGWTLPLAIDSPDLQAIAQDLTRFYLYKNQMIDVVKEANALANRKLKDYVAGLIEFDIGSPSRSNALVAGATGDVSFTATDDDRIFTMNTLQGF